MSSRIFISILVLLTVPNLSLCAQDFEADSIYYTPIPKVKPEESRKGEQAKRPNPFAEVPGRYNNQRQVYRILLQRPGRDSDRMQRLYFRKGSFISQRQQFTVSPLAINSGLAVVSGLIPIWIGKRCPSLRVSVGTYWARRTLMRCFFSSTMDLHYPGERNIYGKLAQTGVDGGQMVYGMAGMRIKYYDLRLSFSIGGKVQALSSYFETPNYYFDVNGNPIQGTSSRTTIEETMKRFAVTITIGWK